MKPYYIYPFAKYEIFQTPTLWDTYRGYNYIIAHNNKAFIFDPGELSPILNTLEKNNFSLSSIYLTHHHPDHTASVTDLAHKFSCPVYGFKGDQHRLPKVTHTYDANEEMEIGGLAVKVLHLPGHTTGLCAFYFKKMNWLFSNDLVFSLGCGRVFEGTYKQMYESLYVVSQLPPETLIFSSHEYTATNLKFALSTFPENKKLNEIKSSITEKINQGIPTVPTTLEFELKYNPFFGWNNSRLRKSLGADNLENWRFFEKLRILKDQF